MDIDQGVITQTAETAEIEDMSRLEKGDFARPCSRGGTDGTQQVGRENVSS
jgi:hypothetical protein